MREILLFCQKNSLPDTYAQFDFLSILRSSFSIFLSITALLETLSFLAYLSLSLSPAFSVFFSLLHYIRLPAYGEAFAGETWPIFFSARPRENSVPVVPQAVGERIHRSDALRGKGRRECHQ